MRPYKLSALAILAIVIPLLGCQQTNDPIAEHDPSLAITNVTVIDAVAGKREAMTVLLSGDEIIAVEPSAQASFSAPRTLDGAGQFLIPGLWDMHVHITYEPDLIALMPRLFLDYGVTSVRDTGGMLPKLLPEIAKWRAADAVAPRIFYSGPLLDGAKVVYDGDSRPEIGIANATAEQARANLAKLVSAGVDFIKIYELVSPEVFSALVAEAERLELPIAAHVPLALLAGDAGPRVDSMEHLRNIELACANNAEQLLQQRQAQISRSGPISGYGLRSSMHSEYRALAYADMDIDRAECQQVIASLRSTIQVPTLRLNTLFTMPPAQREDWQEHLNRLPAQIAGPWSQLAQRSGPVPQPNRDLANWSMQLTYALHQAGVPIGAGTDTPIGLSIPGYSLHTELERLVQTGLTPMDAIHSATIRPAQFMRLQETYGQIQPGYIADLLLLSADPTEDIRNTRSISTVISKGAIVR